MQNMILKKKTHNSRLNRCLTMCMKSLRKPVSDFRSGNGLYRHSTGHWGWSFVNMGIKNYLKKFQMSSLILVTDLIVKNKAP